MPLAMRRLLHGLLVILICVTITAASNLDATAVPQPPTPSSAPNQAQIDRLTKQLDQLTRKIRAVDAVVAANDRVATLIALREDLIERARDLLGQAAQTTDTSLAANLADQVLRIIGEVKDLDQRVRASDGKALAGSWQLAGRWLGNNRKGLSQRDVKSVQDALRIGQAFADLGDPPVLGAESQLRSAAIAATDPVTKVVARLRLDAYLRDRAGTTRQHVSDGLRQLDTQLTGLAGSAPLGATGAAGRLVQVPSSVNAVAANASSQATALRRRLADAQHQLAVETSRNKPITEVDPINVPGAVVEDTQTSAVTSGEWTGRGADGLSVLPGAHSLPQQLISDALAGLAGTTRHWTSTTTKVERVRWPSGALIERTEVSVSQLKQAQLVNSLNPNPQPMPLPHLAGLDPRGLLNLSLTQGRSVTVTGPVKAERPTEQVSVTTLVLQQPTDGSAPIPVTAWGPLTSSRPVSDSLLTPGGVSESQTSGISASHTEPLDVRALQALGAWLAGRGTPLPPGFIGTYSGLSGGGLLQLKISLTAQFRAGRTSGADQDIPPATLPELLRELSGDATTTAETSLVVDLSVAGQTLRSWTLFKGKLDISGIGQLIGALDTGIVNLWNVVRRVTGEQGTGPTTGNQSQPAMLPTGQPSPTAGSAPTAQSATATPGAQGTTQVDSPVRLHGQPPAPGGQIVYALYDRSGDFLRFGTTGDPATSSDQPVDMFVLATITGSAGAAADGTSWTAEQNAADYATAIERYLTAHWGGTSDNSPEWTLIHSANSDGWPLGSAQEADLVAQLEALVARVIPEALREHLAELRAQLREIVGPEQRAGTVRSLADLESLVSGGAGAATGEQGGTATGGAAAGLTLVPVDLGDLGTPQGFPGTQRQLPQPAGYPADPGLAAALAEPGQRPQVDLPAQQGYPADPGLGRQLATPPARVPVELPPNYAASVGTATAGAPAAAQLSGMAPASVTPGVVSSVSTMPGSVTLPSAATQGLATPGVEQVTVEQPSTNETNAVDSGGSSSPTLLPGFRGTAPSGAPAAAPAGNPDVAPDLPLAPASISDIIPCRMVASLVNSGCGNNDTDGWQACGTAPPPGGWSDACYTKTSPDGTVTRCEGTTCTSVDGTVRTACDTDLHTNVQTCGQTNDQTKQVSTCVYDPNSPAYCAQLNPDGTEVRCTMKDPNTSCTLDGNNSTTTCDRTGPSMQCSQTSGNTTTTCLTEHMRNVCNSTGPGTTARCDNTAQVCTGTTPDISRYACSTAGNGDRDCTYTYKNGTTATCTVYQDGQHCDSTAGGTRWSCDSSGTNQVCSGKVNGQNQTCQGKQGSAPDTCVITNSDGSFVCTGKNLSCAKNTGNVTITTPTHVSHTQTANDNGNASPMSSAQAKGTLKADGSNDPTRTDQAHHQQTTTDSSTGKANGSNDSSKTDQQSNQNPPQSAQSTDNSAKSSAPNSKPSVTSSTTPSQMATIQQDVNNRVQQAADNQGIGANGPGGGNW
jgi:hypothetical protein